MTLPVKNLPVLVFSEQEQVSEQFPILIRRRLTQLDSDLAVLAIPGMRSPNYTQVKALAKAIADGAEKRSVLVCVQADMAKALGHSLCMHLPTGTPCLCIDKIKLYDDSYLDVGCPVGPCLPVVVKTLAFSDGKNVCSNEGGA